MNIINSLFNTVVVDRKSGRKSITIKYSDFYRCYFIWSDLTEEEFASIEGVDSIHIGPKYAEVTIDKLYDDEIVLNNIKKLANRKASKGFSLI